MKYYAENSFLSELESGFTGRLYVCDGFGTPAFCLYNRIALFCRRYELRRADDTRVGKVRRGFFFGLFGGWRFDFGEETVKAKAKTEGKRTSYLFSDGMRAEDESGAVTLYRGGDTVGYANAENGRTAFEAASEEDLCVLLALTVAERWD